MKCLIKLLLPWQFQSYQDSRSPSLSAPKSNSNLKSYLSGVLVLSKNISNTSSYYRKKQILCPQESSLMSHVPLCSFQFCVNVEISIHAFKQTRGEMYNKRHLGRFQYIHANVSIFRHIQKYSVTIKHIQESFRHI